MAILDHRGRGLRRTIGFTQSFVVEQEPRTQKMAESLCGFQIYVEEYVAQEEYGEPDAAKEI